jgi:hypothetical protein
MGSNLRFRFEGRGFSKRGWLEWFFRNMGNKGAIGEVWVWREFERTGTRRPSGQRLPLRRWKE